MRKCSANGCDTEAVTLLAFDTTPAAECATYEYLWHCDRDGHWQAVWALATPGSEYAYSDEDISLA